MKKKYIYIYTESVYAIEATTANNKSINTRTLFTEY